MNNKPEGGGGSGVTKQTKKVKKRKKEKKRKREKKATADQMIVALQLDNIYFCSGYPSTCFIVTFTAKTGG